MTTQQLSNSATQELSDDVALSVRHVSKKFCKNLRRSMAYGIADLARNLVGIRPDSTALRRDEFWALRDVSFDLHKGEALGLIGANGSGKSTLLRMIAGIFPPDDGEIAVRGRVGALIALGAGFHPHMTGRENIYLNGSILGMTRAEIDAKYNDIVEFSGIADFMEAPVSTYSSGMRVRLGFSVAVHTDPDVLLMDEILAVGDTEFQNRSLERLVEMKESGKTILFVSHRMDQVLRFCENALLLDEGRRVCLSPCEDAVDRYREISLGKMRGKMKTGESADGIAFRKGTGKARIEAVRFLDASGQAKTRFQTGERVAVEIVCDMKQALESPAFVVQFWTVDGFLCHALNTNESGFETGTLDGRATVCAEYDRLNLLPGLYRVTVGVLDRYGLVQHDLHYRMYDFIVEHEGPGRGSTYHEVQWSLRE